jgi:hypothetical protein
MFLWNFNQDEELDLPSLSWIPNLHKCPFRQRYIAGSAKCFMKPLSKLLIYNLSAVKTGRRISVLFFLLDLSLSSTRYLYLLWPFFFMKHSWTNPLNLSFSSCLSFFYWQHICFVWWTCFFQQTVAIPMGTNCAPLLTDLFLYSHEAIFIQGLYTPPAGAAGMLLHINGKFTMGKLKSSLLS